MSTNIYVGNLPFSSTEAQVHELFSQFGPVESVKLITDRDTGRPRGFGFVEMSDSEHAAAAIDALDQQGFGEPPRPLTVNLARPREERPRPNPRW
ncbi:RNA-binding protein [Candidatus Entotheonella serta]|nr:RNA-binding protein [Candidatus Entotheonella serta]